MPLTNNTLQSRYELTMNGEVVFARYKLDGSMLSILHVEAPEALRGTGAAGQLMERMLADIRARGLKVIPICGYAAMWIKRHKEYQDLLA